MINTNTRQEESKVDIVAFFERYIYNLRDKRTKTHGGEWCGKCPLPSCSSQNDGFLLWPARPPDDGPLWTCRKCRRSGGLRSFIYLVAPHEYGSICHELGLTLAYNYEPRGTARTQESTVLAGFELLWKDAAHWFARACKAALHDGSDVSNKWLAYLYSRGFTDETIEAAHIGLNKETLYDKPLNWGVSEDNRKAIWLPRGLVIPWIQDKRIVKLNIRRAPLDVKRDREAGKSSAKYVEVTGSEQDALYGLDTVLAGAPLALCEGEFDALALRQVLSGEVCGIVATGSAARGLTVENIARLAFSSEQLVMFDFDENGAGDTGAQPWLSALPAGFHWSPPILGLDVNGMLQEQEDVKAWFFTGLESAQKYLSLQTRQERSPEYNAKGVSTLTLSKEASKIASQFEELNAVHRCACGEAGAVHGKDGTYYCALCAFERMPIEYTPPLVGSPREALLFMYMRPDAGRDLAKMLCFACENAPTCYDLHARLWCAAHAPLCAGVIGESLPCEPRDGAQDADTCYLCEHEIDVTDLHLRYYCAGCAPVEPYIDVFTFNELVRFAQAELETLPTCALEVCSAPCAQESEWCEEHANCALLLNMLKELGYPPIQRGTVRLASGEEAARTFVRTASFEDFCDILVVVYRLYKHIPEPEPPKIKHLEEERRRKRPVRTCDYYACDKPAAYRHASGLAFCMFPGCEARYGFMLAGEKRGYPEVSYMPVNKGRGAQTLKAGIEAYKEFARRSDWRDVETITALLEQKQESELQHAAQ